MAGLPDLRTAAGDDAGPTDDHNVNDGVSVAWVNLTNGGMSGGYRKYMEAMLPRMARDPRFRHVTVHSPADFGAVASAAQLPSYRWPTMEFLRGFPTLRRQLHTLKPDLVFVPTHRYVNTGRLPLVVMFRNMECALRPWGGNDIAEGIKNLARRTAARRAVRKADGVIAVSRFVADFLRERWHVDPRKMRIVYHGVADDAREPVAPPRIAASPPFIFTAGSIRPFRGLEDLVEAMAYLPERFAGYRLVVAGRVEGRVQAFLRRLHARIDALGVAPRIVWAGTLSPSEMVWCFRHCGAFVTTSRVEACPNTALEAMHHGAASVSTDNPPMPEFFGEAAQYYSAGDGKGLADALSTVLGDERRRLRLQAAGQERTAEFTWKHTYALTADFLLEVARQRAESLGTMRRAGV